MVLKVFRIHGYQLANWLEYNLLRTRKYKIYDSYMIHIECEAATNILTKLRNHPSGSGTANPV